MNCVALCDIVNVLASYGDDAPKAGGSFLVGFQRLLLHYKEAVSTATKS
jgi:hypothetical protein